MDINDSEIHHASPGLLRERGCPCCSNNAMSSGWGHGISLASRFLPAAHIKSHAASQQAVTLECVYPMDSARNL